MSKRAACTATATRCFKQRRKLPEQDGNVHEELSKDMYAKQAQRFCHRDDRKTEYNTPNYF